MTTLTSAGLRAGRAPDSELRSVRLTDPVVQPMLTQLAHEYTARYHDTLGADRVRAELEHYPAEEFLPPHGELVVLLEGGRAIAGGAFRRRHEPELGDPELATGGRERAGVHTAELKRIWTDLDHRRRGLARIVVADLERRAAASGYHRIYLTTGPRQPEASALYLTAGYTPLFDVLRDPEEIGPLPFEKWISADTPTQAAR